MPIYTPDWVKHAVFYQIFPDRFAKGGHPSQIMDASTQLEAWEAAPTLQGYKGGNLWGVIEQLDYIQDLGFNAIYFTPVFQSTCNHRYHTQDYYQIDPLLGGNEALYRLLEAAHWRGIKVVLDGVFNHVGRGFFFFNDILENGPHSPWIDWFKIEGWPLSAYDGDRPANYTGWYGNRALPEFNHANPAVREYIMRVAEHWLRVGIDGWRLDVPFCINEPGFWQEFRDRVKGINPNAYIVGEIWRDARKWLDGTQFDAVMNYPFTGATIAFTGGAHLNPEHIADRDYDAYPAIDAATYADRIQLLLHAYPWDIQLAQMNLLASHDTARLLTIANGDVETVKLATLMMMTFPGAPSIYYGDEVGLEGALDPDSRRSFPAREHWHPEIMACHRRLIALRHSRLSLRIGEYRLLGAEDHLYVFARIWEGDVLIVAINAGETLGKIDLDAIGTRLHAQPSRVLYSTGEYDTSQVVWTADNLFLGIPARTGIVLG
ncbi:glycoside hydrolase family 13 protein [Phormidium tenue FACHB-886]|nr:glycoside hydrolase family 13 protein [Phormidium tenue FACHB-886]